MAESGKPAARPIGDIAGMGIIITGGGGSIGSVMAAEFCRLGARVLVCGRRREPLEAAVAAIDSEMGPGRAFLTQCDVRQPETVAAMIDASERVLGSVDGLVNNAAGMFPVRSEELSPNGFRSVVSIVLEGSFNCTREVAQRWLRAGRGGAVVNILHTYAWTGGAGIVHSASAKAGVLAMTKTLGAEWAGRGIRVNAVAPGWTEVGGTGKVIQVEDAGSRDRLLKTIPAGRFLRSEEVARATAYLLSEDASYVVGECLAIDGGHQFPPGLLALVDDTPVVAAAVSSHA